MNFFEIVERNEAALWILLIFFVCLYAAPMLTLLTAPAVWAVCHYGDYILNPGDHTYDEYL